jgi:hypothetical protein
MSKAETTGKRTDDTFATKLGIEMGTPRTFERLIERNALTRLVVTAVGPSGIGKTAIPKQVAARRNGGKPWALNGLTGVGVPYVALHMPTMSLEDFHIPTFSNDDKLYYDRRVSKRFKILVDWIAKVKSENKGVVPADMAPILAFEELNRAVDKSVTRAAFTMLDDRALGDAVLDDAIQFVVTMNPSGGGMAVNEFERDPAMRRRLAPMLGVSYDYAAFMAYATKAKFHPSVLGHLGSAPSQGYDEVGAESGKVFASPATWEAVSHICRAFDEQGESINSHEGKVAVTGAIGGSAAAFLEFVKDHTLMVTPDDILTSYGPGTETQRRFLSYLAEDGAGGRLDKVNDLTMGVAVKVFTNPDRRHESIVKSLSCFYGDLPTEVLMALTQRLVEEANRAGGDAKNWFHTLNQKMGAEKTFTDAMLRLHNAKQAAAAVAKAAPAK